jgi:hypothetical protein
MRTYEEISEILANVADEVFEKLNYWFDKWVFGEAPKARANYWLNKVGITEDEYWMWQAM